MGARTGAGTRSRIDMNVEGKESLGTFKVVIEVGWKTREGKRRQRVASSDTPQRGRRIMRRTRAQRREARDKIGDGGVKAKQRKIFQKSYRRDVENG